MGDYFTGRDGHGLVISYELSVIRFGVGCLSLVWWSVVGRLAVLIATMLAILTTHPIQYQVPLWQRLAADGRVPFEVWYLSEHATLVSHDREFGKEFAWDIDMLKGYQIY